MSATPRESITARLASVLRSLSQEKRTHLERLKAERQQFDRPDFIWHYLLQSFATMGRAAAADNLIGDPERYERVSYTRLERLSDGERRAEVERVCREAGLRMPNRKAEFIIAGFFRIQSLGGLRAARKALLAKPGRSEKKRFLQGFFGIGPKYARNMMMDVYHEEFRDCVAIDSRIQSISTLLGLSFSRYDQQECFYLSVAACAELEGWEVDRLLFHYRDEVARRLGFAEERPTKRGRRTHRKGHALCKE